MAIDPSELTFAVPYYRYPQYLKKTLESLKRQTVQGFRVLVVDDAGPDPGADEVVASFRDERFTYTRNPSSLGIAGNWNRCVELVRTRLFTLLHADDELEPGYAAAMLQAHARNPGATGIYCRAEIIGPDSQPVFSFADYVKRFLDGQGRDDMILSGEDGVRRLMRGCFIMCPTICYNKENIGSQRFDARWRQVLDLEYYVRLLIAGGTWVGIAAKGYRYRRHGGNQTSLLTANLERFREEFALHDDVAKQARALGWANAERVAVRAPMIRLHLLFLALADLVKARWQPAGAKVALLRREGP